MFFHFSYQMRGIFSSCSAHYLEGLISSGRPPSRSKIKIMSLSGRPFSPGTIAETSRPPRMKAAIRLVTKNDYWPTTLDVPCLLVRSRDDHEIAPVRLWLITDGGITSCEIRRFQSLVPPISFPVRFVRSIVRLTKLPSGKSPKYISYHSQRSYQLFHYQMTVSP